MGSARVVSTLAIVCIMFTAGCMGTSNPEGLEPTSNPQPLPKWRMGDATTDSLSLAPGDSTTLRWVLENEGLGAGNFSAGLRINGELVTNLTAQVSAGGSETITYRFRPTEVGIYLFELEGATPLSIAVRQPSDIQVVRMELSSHELLVGESLSVTYEAANRGGMSGEKELALTVNGKEVRKERISLSPGASVEKTVTVVAELRGANVVSMGPHEEKFTALKPAEFVFTNLSVPEGPVPVGETVSILVSVRNDGDVGGSASVELAVDDVTKVTHSQPLKPSEQKTVELQWTPSESRTYTITVGALPSETLVAKLPAKFELSGFTVAPTAVEPNQPVTARVTVRNVGELNGSFPVRFLVNGALHNENVLALEGGGEHLYETSWSSPFPNTYLLAFEGTTGSNVRILKPAEAAFEPFTLSSGEIDAGSSVTVAGTVRNLGEVAGTFTVPLIVNGNVVSTATVQVAAGGSARVPDFTFTPTEGGTYTIAVGDASPQTLTVRVPSLSVSGSFEDWFDTVEVTVTIVNNGPGVAKNVVLDVWESKGVDAKQTTVGDIPPGGRITRTLVLNLNDPDWGCTYYTIHWKATPSFGSAASGSGRYCQ